MDCFYGDSNPCIRLLLLRFIGTEFVPFRQRVAVEGFSADGFAIFLVQNSCNLFGVRHTIWFG